MAPVERTLANSRVSSPGWLALVSRFRSFDGEVQSSAAMVELRVRSTMVPTYHGALVHDRLICNTASIAVGI